MIIQNTGIEVIIAGFASTFIAQLIKFVSHLVTHKKVDFKILTRTGGMPSSHSGGVISTAVTIGLIEGFTSTIFALALALALIVMYDAAGVRQAAGKMAAVLNNLVDDIYAHEPRKATAKLKELLGHTPVEVIMGAFLGVAISLGLHYYLV